MTSLLVRIGLFLLLPALSAFAASDKVVHYDSASSRITIERNNQERTYALAPAAKFTINGAPAPLEKLRPGMMVSLVLANPQTIASVAGAYAGRIQIVSPSAITIVQEGESQEFRLSPSTAVILNGRPSAVGKLAPGMTVSAFSSSPGTLSRLVVTGTRNITIAASIDGKDRLKLKDGELWVEHVGADLPKDFLINNKVWFPVWTLPLSSRTRILPQADGSFKGANVVVTKEEGRPAVKVRPPTPENDYTLTVTLDDPPGGFGDVVVRITW